MHTGTPWSCKAISNNFNASVAFLLRVLEVLCVTSLLAETKYLKFNAACLVHEHRHLLLSQAKGNLPSVFCPNGPGFVSTSPDSNNSSCLISINDMATSASANLSATAYKCSPL